MVPYVAKCCSPQYYVHSSEDRCVQFFLQHMDDRISLVSVLIRSLYHGSMTVTASKYSVPKEITEK